MLWYSRAAQQGLPQAQHALGIMLIGGVAGAPDPVEGYKWLLLAEKRRQSRFARASAKRPPNSSRRRIAGRPRRWRSASRRRSNGRSTMRRSRAAVPTKPASGR